MNARSALRSALLRHRLLWFGVILSLNCRICAAEAKADRPLAVWDGTFSVYASGGYRDNVLLTPVAPESSGFYSTTADAALSRLSETGSQLTFLFLGEDTRYFDAPSVDKEQFFSGSAIWEQPVGNKHVAGASLQYLYQNEVVDVSETEVDLRRLLIEGHALTLRPSWKHRVRPDLVVQLEGIMHRQFYRAEVDDFWEGAGRLSAIHSYGRRSEWALGYQSRHRIYDTRHRADAAGVFLADTSLIYWQHELAGQLRHYWDDGRHWLTVSKAGFLLSRDNGSGYFDYDRVQFSQQMRWENYGWELKLQGRLGHYTYKLQRIEGERRERLYYAVDARVTRRLGRYWRLFAGAEKEWNRSNDPLDEYRDWLAAAGVGFEY